MHPGLATLLAAAARADHAAVLRTDDPDRAFLCVGAREVLSVPQGEEPVALAAFAAALTEAQRSPARDLPCLYGWLTYDAARVLHRGPDTAPRDDRPRADRCPAAYLAAPAAVMSLDLSTGERRFSDDGDGRARIEALLRESATEGLVREPVVFESATGRDAHLAAVASVRESIREGDVYLVNVARMLHARGATPASLAARVLASDARYAALMRTPACTVAAMSMELALRHDPRTRVAITRPIKGTRPRERDPQADAAQARALEADPKERAENAMAVDVHRNDLGRVARVGSVTVPSLCAVESHAFVHHLVSTVRAELDDAADVEALLAALLPVGSVTGAPKLSAMDTIARVEPERRGLYTGVYGMCFGGGGFDLAVAIRTMVLDDAGLHYGVGGGIVWDSDPAREWEELEWKQRAAQ